MLHPVVATCPNCQMNGVLCCSACGLCADCALHDDCNPGNETRAEQLKLEEKTGS